jgi:hypothetical protein
LQDKEATAGDVFLFTRLRSKVLLFELLRHCGVLAFGDCQVAEQLADRGVGDALGAALVKPARFPFHQLGLLTNDADAERPRQPDRSPLDEAFDVVTPDQRNMVAKPLAVRVDEAGPVFRFFRLHFFEHASRGRVRLTQTLGEIAVNAPVLFFERNRQREDLPLRKIFEVLRHCFECTRQTRQGVLDLLR